MLSLFSSLIGGSHYLLLDEISHNLHQHGHEIHMLLQLGNPIITGTLTHLETYFQKDILHNLLSHSLCDVVTFISIRMVCTYLPGFSYAGRTDSHQTSSLSSGEEYIKEYNAWFLEQQIQFLLGRYHIIIAQKRTAMFTVSAQATFESKPLLGGALLLLYPSSHSLHLCWGLVGRKV